MKIIKRNGSVVDFDKSKIIKALLKAYQETPKQYDLTVFSLLRITDNVVEKCYNNITVEQIQDLVVDELLYNKLYEIVKRYISYRAVREHSRNMALEKIFNKMGDIVEYGDNENSNKNYKLPSVQRDTIAGEFFKGELKKNIGDFLYDAEQSGLIHWHDADQEKKLTNCCLVNVEDMLNKGTRITNTDVETPKSVGTAMNIAMQIMASVSSQQYGGVSLPNFNEVFAKYAKKNFVKNFNDYYEFQFEKEYDDVLELDSSNEELKKKYIKVFNKALKKTSKEIYDACQLFEYQTNSILGSASQTPFSTITFNIPTSWESEQIILSYLKVRQTGLGALKIPAIFPKISMVVVDGYNLKKGDPYYYLLEKASKCIALCYYPDILCYSKEDYDAGKYYARMGCRSRVNHEYKENGKYQQYGRFNYGVVTLNLPHIALESLRGAETTEEKVNEFFDILNIKGYNTIKEGLIKRYENVRKLKAKQAPILFQYGAIARLDPDDTIESLLKTDKASVSYGFIGIEDCVRILTDNKENITTDYGHKLGLKIAQTIYKQSIKMKHETGLPVSIYGTPAEASIHTLFQKDLKIFKDVMPDWLKKREYYTNSFHFSSELPIDSFDKIDTESDFIQYCNGGNIMYVENSGRAINNMAIIELIQHAYKKGIEYFAINTISDVCYKCGYTGEISYDEKTLTYSCPHCGNKDGRYMKVQRRSCGYISNYNITHAVEGRMKEIKNRAKHF